MAGGVNIKPKEKIVDFDSADVNDELAVVEYIDDLYQFYKLTEVCSYSLLPSLQISPFLISSY